MSNKGYGSISDPDEEARLVEEGAAKPNLTPQEKYPEANEQEAELLGKLDDIIANADPDFEPPLLPVELIKEGAPRELKALIEALKIPFAAFLVTLAMAAMFVAMNNPVAYALYPYVTCVIIFLGTVPSLKKRFSEGISVILFQTDNITRQTMGQVDGVADKALGYVKSVDDGLDSVIEPIKGKLDQATKLEKMLQKIDPDIDIPDTSDIEEELSDATEKVLGIVQKVKDSLDLAEYIPKFVQSQPMFDNYVVYPFLAGCLLMQLITTYASTHATVVDSAGDELAISGNFTDVNATDVSDATDESILVGNDTRLLVDVLNNVQYNPNVTMTGAGFMDELKDQWGLVMIALNAFIGAVVQILICFIMTQKSIVYTAINKKILQVSGHINVVLDDKVKPVFHDVLVKSMSFVKNELLTIIKKVEKIEGPLNKVSKSIPSLPKNMPSLPKNMPKVEVPKVPDPTKAFGSLSSKKFGF